MGDLRERAEVAYGLEVARREERERELAAERSRALERLRVSATGALFHRFRVAVPRDTWEQPEECPSMLAAQVDGMTVRAYRVSDPERGVGVGFEFEVESVDGPVRRHCASLAELGLLLHDVAAHDARRRRHEERDGGTGG